MAEQFAFPMRVVGGRVATVTHDSPADLGQRVHILCLTPLGHLDSRPDMGLADQRFRKGGADLGEIEGQIGDWVPDAITELERDPTLLDRGLDHLGVKVADR